MSVRLSVCSHQTAVRSFGVLTLCHTLSHPLSLCVSLSLSQKRHTHGHTHTLTHTHTDTHTRARAPTRTCTHIHTRARAHSYTHTHTNAHTHTHTHAHTHLYNHTLCRNPPKRALFACKEGLARGFLSKNLPGDFLIYFLTTNFGKSCACFGSGTPSQGSPQGYATGARTHALHTHTTHTVHALRTHMQRHTLRTHMQRHALRTHMQRRNPQ